MGPDIMIIWLIQRLMRNKQTNIYCWLDKFFSLSWTVNQLLLFFCFSNFRHLHLLSKNLPSLKKSLKMTITPKPKIFHVHLQVKFIHVNAMFKKFPRLQFIVMVFSSWMKSLEYFQWNFQSRTWNRLFSSVMTMHFGIHHNQ